MARSLAPQVAAAIARRGAIIILRTVTPIPAGPMPPVLTKPVLHAALSAGSTTMAIDCGAATGVITVGDRIQINGSQVVVVTQPARSRTVTLQGVAGFDNIGFAPPLSQDTAAGVPLAFKWAADVPLRAILNSYPERLVDGDQIRMNDLRVTIAAQGRKAPNLQTQQLVIAGDVRTIISAIPVFGVGDEIVEWVIQAR